MTFRAFPSIEGFHNIRRAIDKYELISEPVTYHGKVKIHGTNAAVIVMPDGKVRAQSRTQIIASGNDNAGFAAWVEQTNDFWSSLMAVAYTITFYGEWCGPGIQKGTAVNKIPEKSFAIFAMRYDDGLNDENPRLVFDPDAIEDELAFASVPMPKNVHILPWHGDEIVIDFNDKPSLEGVADELNKIVEQVELCDPWIHDTFGVEGVGEGLVFYPTSLITETGGISPHDFGNFCFKAKGEKHKNVKERRAVELDPMIAASIEEFVDRVVTEARLEQGVAEACHGEFSPRLIGPFIGWVSKDVSKETEDELEASELEWKQVSQHVVKAARVWYMGKLEEV